MTDKVPSPQSGVSDEEVEAALNVYWQRGGTEWKRTTIREVLSDFLSRRSPGVRDAEVGRLTQERDEWKEKHTIVVEKYNETQAENERYLDVIGALEAAAREAMSRRSPAPAREEQDNQGASLRALILENSEIVDRVPGDARRGKSFVIGCVEFRCTAQNKEQALDDLLRKRAGEAGTKWEEMPPPRLCTIEELERDYQSSLRAELPPQAANEPPPPAPGEKT